MSQVCSPQIIMRVLTFSCNSYTHTLSVMRPPLHSSSSLYAFCARHTRPTHLHAHPPCPHSPRWPTQYPHRPACLSHTPVKPSAPVTFTMHTFALTIHLHLDMPGIYRACLLCSHPPPYSALRTLCTHLSFSLSRLLCPPSEIPFAHLLHSPCSQSRCPTPATSTVHTFTIFIF